MASSFDNTCLESLEIGATPVVRHFLERLQLEPLLRQHLPANPRRPERVPTAVTLCALVTNLLLALVNVPPPLLGMNAHGRDFSSCVRAKHEPNSLRDLAVLARSTGVS